MIRAYHNFITYEENFFDFFAVFIDFFAIFDNNLSIILLFLYSHSKLYCVTIGSLPSVLSLKYSYRLIPRKDPLTFQTFVKPFSISVQFA